MFLRAAWEACQMLPPADCPQEVYSIMQQCLQYDLFLLTTELHVGPL